MIYVMSDIHGNACRFNSIMQQINLQPDDTLYVLGDVVDRYPDGIRILRLLMTMPNVKMLLGNHEYMMLNAIDNQDADADLLEHNMRLWYRNGGNVTHDYLKHIRKSVRREVFDYLRSVPLNMDIEVAGKKYRLVHGAPIEFYPHYDFKYDSPEQFAVWFRQKEVGLELDGETIIFGHTPTAQYQTNNPLEIWKSEHGGKIGIDCGSGFPIPDEREWQPIYGRLACLRLDDMKVFYSDEDIPAEVKPVVVW